MMTYCGICGGLDHDTWDEGWHVSEAADGTLTGTMSPAPVATADDEFRQALAEVMAGRRRAAHIIDCLA